MAMNQRKKICTLGGAGYRSRYLSHAKRALYHLSYAPQVKELGMNSCANSCGLKDTAAQYQECV